MAQTDPPQRFSIAPLPRFLKKSRLASSTHPTAFIFAAYKCITSPYKQIWYAENLLTGNVSSITFKRSLDSTVQITYTHNDNDIPIKCYRTHDGYMFSSRWTPKIMTWEDRGGGERILWAGDDCVAVWRKGRFWVGRNSGRVEINEKYLREGGWAAFDEVAVTGLGVAELVRRRRS